MGFQTARAEIPVGKSDFVFVDERGSADKPLRVWIYRPAAYTVDSPIVLVMHGKLRNAEDYRKPWIPLAEQQHCLVVAPEFSEQYYPNSHGYNYGNLNTKDGRPIEKSKWAFTALEHLFDHIRALTGTNRTTYHIFGHSAGSQFVHRMVFLLPEARIAKAVAANAGSYTMPQAGIKYPFGLGGTKLTEADLARPFQVPLVVLLGEADTDPNDELLPREPEAMAQGEHRFARGHTFFRAAQAAAARLKTPFKWTLATVPGVGHDNALMAPAAAKALFAD
jgi:poly(3-hydroxybutyrate) depolymerase